MELEKILLVIKIPSLRKHLQTLGLNELKLGMQILTPKRH